MLNKIRPRQQRILAHRMSQARQNQSLTLLAHGQEVLTTFRALTSLLEYG